MSSGHSAFFYYLKHTIPFFSKYVSTVRFNLFIVVKLSAVEGLFLNNKKDFTPISPETSE
jgi:hypothetical protein